MFPKISFTTTAVALEALKFYLADWKRLGVQGPVEVAWDGSGDSGTLTTEPFVEDDERILSENGYAFDWQPQTDAEHFISQASNGDITVKVEQAKVHLFAVLVSVLPLGWEINDGTSGTITLDVVAQTISINGVAHYLENENDLCYSTREWSKTY